MLYSLSLDYKNLLRMVENLLNFIVRNCSNLAYTNRFLTFGATNRNPETGHLSYVSHIGSLANEMIFL